MTTFSQISSTGNGNAAAANDNFSAVSPAGLFGVYSIVWLTVQLYGGVGRVNGALTATTTDPFTLPTLTASATNYVEVDSGLTCSVNTTGFTAGRTPLWTFTTDASGVTARSDKRVLLDLGPQKLSKSVAGGAATFTLTEAEARCDILEFTGAITGAVNVVLPISTKQKAVINSTTGAFTFTVKTASGTGIVIATAKSAFVFGDGTNVRRLSPDT